MRDTWSLLESSLELLSGLEVLNAWFPLVDDPEQFRKLLTRKSTRENRRFKMLHRANERRMNPFGSPGEKAIGADERWKPVERYITASLRC